jgi:K+-sensing histidine kinase KdpD
MMERDPLYCFELAALLEESATTWRHDVRNRLASIRNMTFYLQRKLENSEIASSDPRVGAFLRKIEAEIRCIDELIENRRPRAGRTFAAWNGCARAGEVLELALRTARIPATVDVEADFAEGSLKADALELAMAIRCLLENAAETARARISLTGQVSGDAYRVVVENDGDPSREPGAGALPSEEEPLRLPLRVARRIAARYGSSLSFDSPVDSARARVCLQIPI